MIITRGKADTVRRVKMMSAVTIVQGFKSQKKEDEI